MDTIVEDASAENADPFNELTLLENLQTDMVELARKTPHSTRWSRTRVALGNDEALVEAMQNLKDAEAQLEPGVKKSAAVKLALKEVKQARRKNKWRRALLSKAIPKPLQLRKFENSADHREWPTLLQKKLDEKFDAGPCHAAELLRKRDELLSLADAQDAEDGGGLVIGVDTVVQARSLLKMGKSGGGDGVVVEMVMLLPPLIIYKVASWFDNRFHGRFNSLCGPDSWSQMLMSWVKKTASPVMFAHIRGIVLLAVLGKWYMLCIMILASAAPEPLITRAVCNFGFEKGMSVIDVAGCLQCLLARSYEWRGQAPLCLFNGDVFCAFDHLSHKLVQDATEFCQWPLRCRAAVHQESCGLTCTAAIPGSVNVDFDFNKCMRMGSVESPPLWRCAMVWCVAQLLPLWLECGYGMVLDAVLTTAGDMGGGSKVITHFIWADNVWLLSHDRHSLLKMIKSLGDMLNDKGLFWKPSSLMVMTTNDNDPASYPVSMLNPESVQVVQEIPMVTEMEVLGTCLHRSGRTSTPLDFRLAKAEKALHVHHGILFNKSASLKSRFAEMVKRIYPIVTHGCGSWAWSKETCSKLKTWETELLSRMLVLKKPSNCKNPWRWWARRMVKGRQIFVAMGFQSILVRTLRAIYRFSMRMINTGTRSIDIMARHCLSWRTAQWWETRAGMRTGNYLRHVRGRPYCRWEDAFVRWLGSAQWVKWMVENVPRWKAAEDAFVNFCLAWRCISCAFVGLTDGDLVVGRMEVDPRTYIGPLHLPWHAKNGRHNRVELMGDSKLCVQWLNGSWPMRNNFLRKTFADLHIKLSRWHAFLNVEPRMRHACWARHVFREHNDECDELSKRGLGRCDCGFALEMMMEVEALPAFISGAWDGAYNPGDNVVGIGWTIYGADSFPQDGTGIPSWHCLVRGWGKAIGNSATWSEVIALSCLVTSIDRLFRGHDLGASVDFLECSAGKLTSDTSTNTDPLPFHVQTYQNQWKCFDDVSEDGASSSSASSSSSSASVTSDDPGAEAPMTPIDPDDL